MIATKQVRSAAHEFNNLMQRILGYTRFAMEGLSPNEQRWQDLKQAVEAAELAAGLCHRLLTDIRDVEQRERQREHRGLFEEWGVRVDPPAPPSPQSRAAGDAPFRPAATRETLLLAEGDGLLRALAARSLRGAGYALLTASSVEEAARLFADHRGRITLVVLDAALPGPEGAAARDRIRALDPDVPILLCEGGRSAGGAEGPEDVDAVIQKPFDGGLLLHAVREALNRAQACRTMSVG